MYVNVNVCMLLTILCILNFRIVVIHHMNYQILYTYIFIYIIMELRRKKTSYETRSPLGFIYSD